MGFEVNYFYYEKLENSFEYNREEEKTFKKVYGKAIEDYPLEKLASAVQQQMARRDIFVFNFEIFEFQKKKINWKQNKSDLIIKNKKFTNDGRFFDVDESGEAVEENRNLPVEYNTCENNTPNPPPKSMAITPSSIKLVNLADKRQNSPDAVQSNTVPSRVVRHVCFMPSKLVAPVGNFTPEKTYPVYSEIINPKTGIGMIIEILDDRNNRVKVPDEHFVPATINLYAGELFADQNTPKVRNGRSGDGLAWQGVVEDQVIDVRSR